MITGILKNIIHQLRRLQLFFLLSIAQREIPTFHRQRLIRKNIICQSDVPSPSSRQSKRRKSVVVIVIHSTIVMKDEENRFINEAREVGPRDAMIPSYIARARSRSSISLDGDERRARDEDALY